jgi:hypothetical protein
VCKISKQNASMPSRMSSSTFGSDHSGLSIVVLTDGKCERDIFEKRIVGLKGVFNAEVVVVTSMETEPYSGAETLNVSLSAMETYSPSSRLFDRILRSHNEKKFVAAIIDHCGGGFDVDVYGRKWLSTEGKLYNLLRAGCDCVLLPKTTSSNIEDRVETYNKTRENQGLRTYDVPLHSNALYVIDIHLKHPQEVESMGGNNWPFYGVVENKDDCAERMKSFLYYVSSVSKSLDTVSSDNSIDTTTDQMTTQTSDTVLTEDTNHTDASATTDRTNSDIVLFTPETDTERSSVSKSQQTSSDTVTSSSKVGSQNTDTSISSIDTSDMIEEMEIDDL